MVLSGRRRYRAIVTDMEALRKAIEDVDEVHANLPGDTPTSTPQPSAIEPDSPTGTSSPGVA